MDNKKGRDRVRYKRILTFITVFLLLGTLAIVRNHALFGYNFGQDTRQADSAVNTSANDRHIVVNTTQLCSSVIGYAGPIPVEIHITDGRIDSVHTLPNQETPGFFHRLEKAGLTTVWNGMTLEEASKLKVDAVSGATFSSNAYITNVKTGVDYALVSGVQTEERTVTTNGSTFDTITPSGVAALAVILLAAIIPLFTRRPAYRLIQQLLNVAVLGFWAGTFIDYTMMLRLFSMAPHFSLAFVITLVLMFIGFVYPLFGRPNYYCNWVCPLGSLQDIAGHCSRKKVILSKSAVRYLNLFRKVLWIVLMAMLYIGWGTSWIDYELFTAFAVQSAAWFIIVIGFIVIVLSIFISKPFCRFVCPTGTLLRL